MISVAGIWLGSWESARAFKRIIVADISKRVYLLLAFQALGEDPQRSFSRDLACTGSALWLWCADQDCDPYMARDQTRFHLATSVRLCVVP
jgi:hypothetical protein